MVGKPAHKPEIWWIKGWNKRSLPTWYPVVAKDWSKARELLQILHPEFTHIDPKRAKALRK